MAGSIVRRTAEALPNGYTLHGKYVIKGVLGQGGFGITYIANDLNGGRRVALKELYPSEIVRRVQKVMVVAKPGCEAAFEKIKSSFSKETMMLVQMQDIQDVVRLYHAFQENGTSYYVMEYLEGKTLSKYLQENGPVSWKELSAILRPVMLTLAKLHQAGVIHRDVSPDNIFLKSNGEVRLIDFGNVRSYGNQNAHTAYIKSGFAPLEQFSSVMPQGPYTDVYSTCVTIYYALSGKLPPGAMERLTKDSMIPLRQLCPELPGNVYDSVVRGMAVRAEDRMQSMDELYQRLFLVEPERNTQSGRATVRCLSGLFAGRTWMLPVERPFYIGRNPGCDIVYPANAAGISRVQVSLYLPRNGKVLACDNYSSCGTNCVGSNGRVRMRRGVWYDVSNCVLTFGAREQYQIGL